MIRRSVEPCGIRASTPEEHPGRAGLMVRRLIACGTASVALLVAFGSLGCTQDEGVSSGNATLLFAASVLSPPASRWDSASFELDRAIVRPLDPSAATNLGDTPSEIQIDVVPGRSGFDLRSSSAQIFFETPLAPGRYALLSLWWYGPVLSDPDADPNAPTCIEKIDTLPPSFATGVSVEASEVALSTPIEFTVPSGSSGRVVVEVNGAGLVADYETRFLCNDAENGSCGVEPTPCIEVLPGGEGGWDKAGFSQAIPQFVTVRVE
jgi:hypothetical protein